MANVERCSGCGVGLYELCKPECPDFKRSQLIRLLVNHLKHRGWPDDSLPGKMANARDRELYKAWVEVTGLEVEEYT